MPSRSEEPAAAASNGRAAAATDLGSDSSSQSGQRMASGKVLIRMPRSLHQRLLDQAAVEGVSANQLAVAILARGLG